MTPVDLRAGRPHRTRVAVALGGGGARGYAHIGVLEVLAERGYEIVGIAGSSMGALIGGLYAADGLGAFTDWIRGLSHRDVLRLYDLSPRAPGAIRAERIFARVSDILGDVRIEELPLAFTAVATDLEAGEERWFREGPLAAAVRASVALPGFMTPVVIEGRLLADGGLLSPLPLAPAVTAGADLTVAVAVGGRIQVPSRLRTIDVMGLSVAAVRAAAVRQALAEHPPDVLITVPRASCRTLDFHRAGDLIALGRILAVEALDARQVDGPAPAGALISHG